MPPLLSAQSVRRLLESIRRGLRPRRGDDGRFERVNRVAGTVPLQPELSGLRVRKHNSVPRRALRTLVTLGYRWQPSAEYRRRQEETQTMNRLLREAHSPRILPPILGYSEEVETVTPIRFRPSLDAAVEEGGVRFVEGDESDLSDLEAEERRREPRLIAPLIPVTDASYLATDRPLLPRRFRTFLRHSPYARGVLSVLAVALTIAALLWISDLHQQEAVAASRYHAARGAFQSALIGALAYGVDPRNLRPLEQEARSLDAVSVPSDLVIGRARLSYYHYQEERYEDLLTRLHHLEAAAMRYWTREEGLAYAPLVEATNDAASLGLPVTVPALPVCGTPRCFRDAVAAQSARTAWLRETAATLRVYAAAVLTAPDPAAAAATLLQEAQTLSSIVPHASLPAPTATLSGALATATAPQDDARVGALAHLDVDALHLGLVASLPRRAILISLEDGAMALYQQGRVVYRSPIAAGPDAPTGIFSVQAKQASLPALLWNSAGRYVNGTILDWMPFASDAALEGAPWRSSFGPGYPLGPGAPVGFAPQATRSIDLPAGAARFLFSWASVGTEVVIY